MVDYRIGVSGLYLLYCLFNKSNINADVRRSLRKQQISYTRYFTTPAPLQNWLWFVVAGNDSGYHVGYRSLFDHSDTIAFQYFPRNDSLLQPMAMRNDVHRLMRFAQEYYTVEKYYDTLVFNDLRFGQEVGWFNPHGKFAFHYYLESSR
jgi:inner membrane protein